MTIHKTIAAVLGAGALLLTGCATGQPHPGCYMQSASSWFFAYDRTSATPTCSQEQLARLSLNGERVGVYKYREPGAASAQLVMRPTALAGLAGDPLEAESFEGANATGSLAAEPDDSLFCAVEGITPASAAGPDGTVTYQFSDMRTYAGARSLGQQLTAKLTYTEPGTGGACVMQFDVKGVWPRVACDPDLDPATATGADAAAACGEGSGANEDIAYRCVHTATDEDGVKTGYCAPRNATPSYKEGVEEIQYDG